MYCAKCGTENANESSFCQSCGAPLTAPAVSPDPNPVDAPAANPAVNNAVYGNQPPVQNNPGVYGAGVPAGNPPVSNAAYGNQPPVQNNPGVYGAGAPVGNPPVNNAGYGNQPPVQNNPGVYGTGAPVGNPGWNNMGYGNVMPVQNELPMKWHAFLVYFALWAGAVFNLISGFMSFTGSQYGSSKGAVYLFFPGMKAIDVISGFLMLICAAVGFVTAYRLLKMKKGSPMLLTLLYVINAVASLFYCIAASVVLSSASAQISSIVTRGIGSVIGSVVIILINWVYYKKREHLFVN